MVRRSGAVLLFITTMLFISFSFAPVASANAGEYPYLTIVASFAPDDMTLSLRFTDGTDVHFVKLYRDSKAKAWETYFRLYSDSFNNLPKQIPWEGAVLVVESGNSKFECPFSKSLLSQYNSLLRLDIKNQTIIGENSVARSILLISMRVILTMLIEGLVFISFGYRGRANWIFFTIINLITQGLLNMCFNGPNFDVNLYFWPFLLIIAEIFIFITEAIAFKVFVNITRQEGLSPVVYSFTANFCSLLLGGAMISLLPV